MADNQPNLPNSFVNFNNQNLGLLPQIPTGQVGFVGIGLEGTATLDAIETIVGPNEVRTKIGFGEVADFVIDHFNNQGQKVHVVPIDITTLASLGTFTITRTSGSTGTITVAPLAGKKVLNEFDLEVIIKKTGALGTAKFTFSTDKGVTVSPELIIPASGLFTIPNTNIELTFVPGAGPTIFEIGDLFDALVVGKPLPSTGDIETAVDTLIASAKEYDYIVIAADVDAALTNTLKTKVVAAEGTPNFRFFYIVVHPALSTSASQAVTQATTFMAAVSSDRIQVHTGEMSTQRPNHGDTRDRNTAGIVSGRRSGLSIQNDVGLVGAGPLANILAFRTGWTDTEIESLDGLNTVTVRDFKSIVGFFPTNGPMSDPLSDFRKDAFRLVVDKAARVVRQVGLTKLKIDLDPANLEASTNGLKNEIQGAVDQQIVGNGEAIQIIITIPTGQDVLATELLDVVTDVFVFSHASFIRNTVQIGVS